MALQYSVAVRNAQLDAIETAIGASAKLRLYTGSAPANCAASATGTLLVEIALPADYMAAAVNGSKSKQGVWAGIGIASGNAGYFREYDNSGNTAHIQGTITATGGGGDMTIDNINIAVNQNISTNTFTINAGNA